jgi:uncharacterized repeat protein (TIGR03843 family)
VPGDERSPRPVANVTSADEDALRLLEHGELELLGLLPRSSNYTFLAKATDGAAEVLAVYKPRRGEAPLWDFPEGTLCQREVAAFVVANALGWPTVPPTVLREGPEGPGSVQRFVEFDPRQHFFTMQDERPDDFRRVALFDAVVNNADRKSGHCLLSTEGLPFCIDHGVCFHEEPKLRTVIWDFAGERIPPPLLGDLRRFGERLSAPALRSALGELLSEREVEAMDARLAALIAAGCFPEPGPDRPYPWPPV